MIDRLKKFLQRYDLTYTETKESLVIKLRFSLQVHVKMLSDNQDYHKAIECFKKAIDNDLNCEGAYTGIGRALLQKDSENE